MVKRVEKHAGKLGIRKILQWFMPGLGVKRWFGVLLAGITLSGMGLALFIIDRYRNFPESDLLPVVAFLSLRFLPRLVRVLVFGSIGIGLIITGLWGINRSLMVPFLQPGKRLVDQVTEFRRRERGPRVVVIGGGHGIATVLRGLKEFTNNMTAIVSVADDGGSSGELRRSLGIPPPGDIRNCLAALSDDEALLTQLFQYRFGADTGLGGHTFGNLFISALVDITGSFEEAVSESGRALSVHGRVLPSTLHDVKLVADVVLPQMVSEMRVEGESQIPKALGRVRRVWLEPNDAPAFPAVIQAILSADMIIVGPGSLYTSILPNLLVNDVLEAVRASRGLKIFVTNLMNQAGETESYSSTDHLRTIEEVIGPDIFNIIVNNSWYDIKFGTDKRWVHVDPEMIKDPRLYQADLADHNDPIHHDAEKLGKALMDLYYERTGPLG
jgi:uncharacterized cofD-like protein